MRRKELLQNDWSQHCWSYPWIYPIQISKEDAWKIAVILLAKAPDVGRMDNTFHYINLYPVDSAVRFINSYPLITMYPSDSAMRHLKNWAQNYKLRIRDFTIAFYSTHCHFPSLSLRQGKYWYQLTSNWYEASLPLSLSKYVSNGLFWSGGISWVQWNTCQKIFHSSATQTYYGIKQHEDSFCEQSTRTDSMCKTYLSLVLVSKRD